MPDAHGHSNILDRIGIPRSLAAGYLALAFFMIGDGVEQGYLSAFLNDQGFAAHRVALMFTLYGVTAGVSAWMAAALSDVFGPRRLMAVGVVVWVVFHVLFITLGVTEHSGVMLLVCYGLRGFGYPLFAYGFLMWIVRTARPEKLGVAVGWFWFAYIAGFSTLSPLIAKESIALIGPLPTLWSALLVIAVGAVIALNVHAPGGDRPAARPEENPLRGLVKGVSVLWQEPKVAAAGLIRVVNGVSQFGFPVFLPVYFTKSLGFPLGDWLTIYSVMYMVNLGCNLLAGYWSDKYGVTTVLRWMGCVGCAVTTVAFYYIPTATHSFWLSLITGSAFCACLAGFSPMSALMPQIAPRRTGAAMAGLNLGAGLGTAAGPALVGLCLTPLGVAGVMWVFGACYLVGALLTAFLRLPAQQGSPVPATEPSTP
ncbi:MULTISPECIES: MFS transporter [unclassified Streptomyces]|uniref:MFS transporter n=1 Tax=unclassified Streptomyces TaxID=2593676 RepID=UPI002E224C0E|nr:MFS transporter [Streptomyces sp. NBC_01023]